MQSCVCPSPKSFVLKPISVLKPSLCPNSKCLSPREIFCPKSKSFVPKANLCPKSKSSGSRQAVRHLLLLPWLHGCCFQLLYCMSSGATAVWTALHSSSSPHPPSHTHTHLTSAYLMPRQNQTLWPKLTGHM